MISEYQISKQFNSLKKDYDKIENLVSGVQNWIVSSNLNLPTTNYDYSFAYLALNIPTEHVSDFLADLNEIGKTNNISIEQHGISDDYIDNESRIKPLEKANLLVIWSLFKKDYPQTETNEKN